MLSRDRLELGLLGVCVLGMLVFAVHGPFGNGDILVFHRYALHFWIGPHAFHRLPTEYPPPALLVFSLTLLPPLSDFSTVFGLWMAAVFLLGYYAFRRFSSGPNASLYALYLLVGAVGGLLGRYDLLPALLAVGALWACRRDRFWLAYLLLAAGTMLKLYPLVLVPLVMIQHRRLWPSLAGAGLVGGLVAAGFGVGYLLAGDAALGTFQYAGTRPLQVESLGATFLWLGSFLGFPAVTEHGWASYNLAGPLDALLIPLVEGGGVAGLLFVYWRFLRGALSLERAFLAAVCLTLLGSKVFSPQYVMWALPLVVEAEGVSVLWLAICACTTLIFPVLYVTSHVFGTPGPLPYPGSLLGTIAIRNLLLTAATVRLLVPWPIRLRLPVPQPVELELEPAASISAAGD